MSALFVCKEEDNARVNVARTGSHHNAFERSHTHRGVDRFSAVNSSHRAAVSKVTCNDLEVFDVFAEHFSGSVRNEEVARSVEAVSADSVFFVVFVVYRIHISVVRHRVMESGVESSRHESIREKFLAGPDSDDVSRNVKRSEVVAFLNSEYDVVGNFNAAVVVFAGMNESVSDRRDLRFVFDNAVFGHHIHDFVQSDRVVSKRKIDFDLVFRVRDLKFDVAFGVSDLLGKTFRDDGLVSHVEKLVLD